MTPDPADRLDLLRRPRRLRATAALREMVRETTLRPADLILPLFVSAKIASAPAHRQSCPAWRKPPSPRLVADARAARELGVRAVLLFGIPAHKDEQASGAYADDGIIQQAVRALKAADPELVVITDVCLCEYMSHGHCGITERGHDGHFHVLNDASVALLARTAVSHAAAGADIVAPSDMMDGRVRAIRAALDARGFENMPVMSYASKFSSSFYGPFREAAEGAPQYGDRRTYQMDPGNAREALREAATDVEESADMLIVKPGLPYLDILWRVKEAFGLPTAVYNVSGEYAMVKAAAEKGLAGRARGGHGNDDELQARWGGPDHHVLGARGGGVAHDRPVRQRQM